MNVVQDAINELQGAGHEVTRDWFAGPLFNSLIYVDGRELTERQAVDLASKLNNQ